MVKYIAGRGNELEKQQQKLTGVTEEVGKAEKFLKNGKVGKNEDGL